MKILTPQEAHALWQHLGPGILEAISRNGPPPVCLMMELPQAIFKGNVQVLVGDEGFGVVFIDGPVCNLVAYQGTLKEVKALKAEFLGLAGRVGCKTIRLTGDPAWMRVVPELRQRAVVMEMDVKALEGK